MFMPSLGEIPATRDMISEFQGYNHNLVLPENQFYNMKNMTSSFYPVLSPRGKRGIIRPFQADLPGEEDKKDRRRFGGLFAKDQLCWVENGRFYYGGRLCGDVMPGEKQFVSMGAYLLIWPDKKYFDLTYFLEHPDDTEQLFPMESTFTTQGKVTFTLCNVEGEAYQDYTVSAEPPVPAEAQAAEEGEDAAAPADGVLWLDISQTPHVLKQYSASEKRWQAIPVTYVRIAYPGIGGNFEKFEGVSISGVTALGAYNDYFNKTLLLYQVSQDYLVVPGVIDAIAEQTDTIVIKREVPDMDFVTECNNRIWGCSSEKHEIYACMLGRPKVWNSYMGLASDSYAATVGSDGRFTGACSHLGYVLFFKEDCIHKVFGSKPANFQISSLNVRGVQKGSEKSLVIVNETLYYKSRTGVCAYDGSLPVDISAAFGNENYSEAAAGTVGSKYYISMKDSRERWSLFVYDSNRGTWHREDDTHASSFARLGGELYFVDETPDSVTGQRTLKNVGGNLEKYTVGVESGGESLFHSRLEDEVEWAAETGDLCTGSPDSKYVSKIQLRLTAMPGSMLKVSLQYDSSGNWEDKLVISPVKKMSFTVPVHTRRCDHLRIRLSGVGDCKIFSISKMTEDGGEA